MRLQGAESFRKGDALMDQQITFQMVAFFVTVAGALAGVWWRIEARIDKANTALTEALREVKGACHSEAATAHAAASLVGEQLAEFRLHCSETYVRKDGLREMRDELVGRIGDVKLSVDHLNDRMDRVIEAAHPAPAPQKTPSARATRG